MATPVAPAGGFVNGGWYNGQQYWNGTFSAPGVINSQSNQQGAGQAVSAEVNNQTNPNNNAYLATQQQAPQNPVTAPTTSGVPGSTGGTPTVGTGQIASAPTFNLVAATEAAYNTPEIQAAQQAIATRQQALADAQAEINDNPFYSEATRVGKSQRLTQEANADIQVQQDNLTRLQADAAIKVNAQQGQYNIDEQAYKDNLSNFNNILSSGGLDNASAQDIANYAVQTGIPTSMIQSMVNASQKKDNPTQLIQSTDNSGNLTLLAVDSNGKVLNTTTIPGAGKASTTGSATAQKASDLATNMDNLTTDIKNKVTLKSLIDHYSSAISIDDIYRLYNENSPWGAAKETLAQVKQGQFVD